MRCNQQFCNPRRHNSCCGIKTLGGDDYCLDCSCDLSQCDVCRSYIGYDEREMSIKCCSCFESRITCTHNDCMDRLYDWDECDQCQRYICPYCVDYCQCCGDSPLCRECRDMWSRNCVDCEDACCNDCYAKCAAECSDKNGTDKHCKNCAILCMRTTCENYCCRDCVNKCGYCNNDYCHECIEPNSHNCEEFLDIDELNSDNSEDNEFETDIDV